MTTLPKVIPADPNSWSAASNGNGHRRFDPQCTSAVAEPDDRNGQRSLDHQEKNAEPDRNDQPEVDIQVMHVVPDPVAFIELRVLADCYYDTQENRKRCVNRIERGGVAPDLFAGQIEAIRAAEHQTELALVRCYRRLVREFLPGVHEWQQREQGIGEKLLARLLGHLGHPRIARPAHWEGTGDTRTLVWDQPFIRTAAQLRAYCGHGDPERKKRKGMTAEEAFTLGNPMCKMLVHLLAESTMKRMLPEATANPNSRPEACQHDQPTRWPDTDIAAAGGADGHQESVLAPFPIQLAVPGADLLETTSTPPSMKEASRDADHDQATPATQRSNVVVGYTYRSLYEQRRKITVVNHPEWTALHQHNDALRIVGKAILNDLWTAAGTAAIT